MSGIQSLELQNAETKRVGAKNGSKRLEFVDSEQQTRVALRHGQCGPARLTTIAPAKRGTTMALSQSLSFSSQNATFGRGMGCCILPRPA